MTYAELLQAVQDYTENQETSFVDNIPLFVKQTEKRIYNLVPILATRKNSTGSLTASNKYLTLPTDWLATHSLAVIAADTSQSYLLDKDVSYIRSAFPDPTQTGVPTHYASFDADTLILGPTPATGLSVELHYFAYPESIVDAGTSWLGDNFDMVLLYGTLVEAYIYLKGEKELMDKYQTMYDNALVELKVLSDGKNRQDSYRSGLAKYPVK